MSNTNSYNVIKQYAAEIPKEVKLVVRALDDDIRLAIIIILIKNSKMSFSKLKRLLNVNSSSLSHHLSILQNGGLINNFLELKKRRHSYYMVTDIAKLILESLFDIIVRIQRVGFEGHKSLRIESRVESQRDLFEFKLHNIQSARSFESPTTPTQ